MMCNISSNAIRNAFIHCAYLRLKSIERTRNYKQRHIFAQILCLFSRFKERHRNYEGERRTLRNREREGGREAGREKGKKRYVFYRALLYMALEHAVACADAAGVAKSEGGKPAPVMNDMHSTLNSLACQLDTRLYVLIITLQVLIRRPLSNLSTCHHLDAFSTRLEFSKRHEPCLNLACHCCSSSFVFCFGQKIHDSKPNGSGP